jgi:hypothetical protein
MYHKTEQVKLFHSAIISGIYHVYGMKNCFVLTFSYLFEDIDFKMTISLDDQIWTRDGREILII